MRDAIVAPRPAVLNALVGLDQSVVFQFVQRGIERTLFEIQYAAGAFLDALGDAIAVARPLLQCFQDQGGQRSLKVHRIPRTPMHRIQVMPRGVKRKMGAPLIVARDYSRMISALAPGATRRTSF